MGEKAIISGMNLYVPGIMVNDPENGLLTTELTELFFLTCLATTLCPAYRLIIMVSSLW
jgi:hypothetical protein